MIYTKQLDVRYDVDVLVVGGGASGVAASVAAARLGKKVLLCEANGCFGGVGTTGLVPAFAPFTDGVRTVAAGIGLEIRKNVSRKYPVSTYWTSIEPEELKREYDRILTEAGVDFLFFTTLCDVVANGDHVEYAVLHSKSGTFAVRASVYVDCTGDGDLVAMAGGAFEFGDEQRNVMPPTLCSFWGNLNLEEYRQENVQRQLELAIEDGIFTYEDRHLSGFFVRDEGLTGGNLGHIFNTDPLDDRSVTRAMVWGRRSMLEYEKFYREYVGGCQNIRLLSTGGMLGVRESRRICCDYMLNVNDFIARANFDDEIGRYCYPVDIHVMDTSKGEYQRFQAEYQDLRYKDGESYGIPFRSLIPVSFSNVLTAGRCMGTDRQMEASIRVMPGCFITGQAAGTAAALAVKSGEVRSVNPTELQRTLLANGAYLRDDLK